MSMVCSLKIKTDMFRDWLFTCKARKPGLAPAWQKHHLGGVARSPAQLRIVLLLSYTILYYHIPYVKSYSPQLGAFCWLLVAVRLCLSVPFCFLAVVMAWLMRLRLCWGCQGPGAEPSF